MSKTYTGYYSIASGRWVSWQEVKWAEKHVDAARAELSAAAKRREAVEAQADYEASQGNYAKARELLAEARRG